ncbi:phage portal protein [Curtobacterium pusillum]|uniref:Phage portal protein n=1 Tax=Curtobacterium pusillum TaxID=69373 RepID=A0ABX2MAI9_9MICO|nr:phage portal protein [Curtobacterium pusillum]NUU12716.1 phage portal protein [Curtobacterium pusillum]GLK31606.1 phage portal protein [Curtobacterium pusillum]
MPSFWSRTAALLRTGAAVTEARSADENAADTMPEGVRPPSRSDVLGVTPDRALTLSTVFRAVQIHTTAVAQLSVNIERGGQVVADTPLLVQKPCMSMSRSRFLEETTAALYLHGNAYWRIVRLAGAPVELVPLDPRKVAPYTDPKNGRKTFSYEGRNDWSTLDIHHLKFLSVPGMDLGLGPIQAARFEIAGALDARDFGSGFFREGGVPSGVLKSDQDLNGDDARAYRRMWHGRDPESGEPLDPDDARNDVRVLGKGLSYDYLGLKPADVQFLESQQFSTTQIARLMGVPSSLFLASVQGGSQTYANVEQDWIGYVRFSLMNVLREMEEAFTDVTPRGQTARFNIDVLLRTDTKTRYEAHASALAAKWKTRDEVRIDEGMAPLTDAQRADIAAAAPAKPATTPQETADA